VSATNNINIDLKDLKNKKIEAGARDALGEENKNGNDTGRIRTCAGEAQ
jgi:hypothetical protein